MSHFAEIDKDGIVLRVIVAEQDFIDAEHEGIGPKENWVQTSYNHRIRKQYAGIGMKYHKHPDLTHDGIFLWPHEVEKADEIIKEWISQGQLHQWQKDGKDAPD